MKPLIALLALIAVTGCASTPAPLLKPGETMEIGQRSSRFDSFTTRKQRPAIVVTVRDSEPPAWLMAKPSAERDGLFRDHR